MIGNRIKKKCTSELITALASKMNGGKAMTPGLSDDVSEELVVKRAPSLDKIAVRQRLFDESTMRNSL